jgi:hypothetical protein
VGKRLLLIAVCVAVVFPGDSAASGAARHGWADVPRDHWARAAIDQVARDHDWMRDFGPTRFRPAKIETKQRLARAVVRAFAPDEVPAAGMRFRDLAPNDPLYPYANMAVKLGWMSAPHHRFHPEASVTGKRLDKVLTLAMGLGRTAAGINEIHTTDGYRFRHAASFGALLIGRLLWLHYNHDREDRDVTPSTPLPRAEVAWSLSRASMLSPSEIAAQLRGYANMHLGPIPPSMRAVVEFGLRYVGFPYVYAGEWASRTPSGYCCGWQGRGGFDCSGLMWWVLRRGDDMYRVPATVRPYSGWDLGERSSNDMARAIPRWQRVKFWRLEAGDLMFYDGDQDGRIDHVDLYLGYGWALDSSESGTGGVSILHVEDGWYRDHFRWGRHIVPRT